MAFAGRDGPTGSSDHHVNHDPDIAERVRAVVAAAVAAIRRAGRISFDGMAAAVEGPFRALTRRVAAEAVAQPRPVRDTGELASALAQRPVAPVLGGATAVAVVARVARRFGPLRFLARRTPMWLVAAIVPALHASVTWGANELALVASHLVHRARAAGVEPDPERVRRAAMQILAGEAVDPNVDSRHRLLVMMWLQRALRATMPLTSGVTTREPERLAAAARDVPPAALGAAITSRAVPAPS